MQDKKTLYYSIKLGIFAVLAILVFIFRETLIENLKYFIGGLMLLYGVEEIAFEIIYSGKHFYHKDKVYLGTMELILGVTLLVAPFSFEAVCVIWGTWSIIRESYEIKEVIAEMEFLVPRIISGLESIVVIIFSIELIINQDHHGAMTHMYLLLVELVLTPLVPLLEEILLKRKQKKEQKEDPSK